MLQSKEKKDLSFTVLEAKGQSIQGLLVQQGNGLQWAATTHRGMKWHSGQEPLQFGKTSELIMMDTLCCTLSLLSRTLTIGSHLSCDLPECQMTSTVNNRPVTVPEDHDALVTFFRAVANLLQVSASTWSLPKGHDLVSCIFMTKAVNWTFGCCLAYHVDWQRPVYRDSPCVHSQ